MSRSVASLCRAARYGRLATLAGLVALVAALVASPVAAYPTDRNWSPPPTVYIPTTGQTIDRLFLDLWRAAGGADSWGDPLTPEITLPNGHIVQYYQYARFEYWPEGDADGNVVVLGNIGESLRPTALASTRGAVARTSATARTWSTTSSAEHKAWIPFPDAESVDLSGDPYQQSTYRFVPETGHGVWGGFRSYWEATGEAAYLGNPLTEEYVVAGTNYQVFERGKLAWREGEDISLVPIGEQLVERYGLHTEPVPQGDIPVYDEELFIPPVAVPDLAAAPPPVDGASKSIVISLSEQALWAYEGSQIVRSTFVSTGTERFKTPTGLYAVNTKMPLDDMEGVLGGEYYNVPEVPDVLYFTNRGHAIHGAYWHDNFGNPMSHGCVNLPLDTSQWLYDWAPVGTPVLIAA